MPEEEILNKGLEHKQKRRRIIGRPRKRNWNMLRT
jgi:hypothetical protein